MLRTLQNRLILSHLLPLLIIIPLTGIAFIYVLETQVILPDLADSLVVEGGFIAEFTSQQPDLWQNPDEVEQLTSRLSSHTNARLMFLDPDGRILVSSDPADAYRIDTILQDDAIAEAQQGERTQHIEFSRGLQQEVIDVFVPVLDVGGEVIGIIRLSHPYTTIYGEFKQLRMLILGVLVFALAVGVGLGSLLALTINTPIKQVTTAIDQLASGNQLEEISQQGPEEIQSLVTSTNLLYTRLKQLESARKQLLANLVHEIGRPLGALRSAIQSIKLGAGKDPQLMDDLTNGMDAEAERLQHLLDELAHMHDQIFGTLEMDRQIISARSWLQTLLRPWEEAAQAKGLMWKVEIPEDLPDFKADPYRLAQAIENLVSNAIKYTPKGGEVRIAACSDEKSIEVLVGDTGPGIDAEEQEKIFEPFYRGTQKRRIKQGMGLGLSIAQDLIVAHGGEIHLESQPGKGSKFTISIPRL